MPERFYALKTLPENTGELSSRLYLDLRANQLSTLPDSLAALTQLRKLDLRWNNFSVIPPVAEKLQAAECRVLL
ncbi:hypothetical protein PQM29_002196 [Morganella morganii]|uniref:hypothetical protein n=1 Tax=Morganella morganii TaxID=582 RepID=UPI001F2D2311|nr:hypothetical protein [Morganella morganii]